MTSKHRYKRAVLTAVLATAAFGPRASAVIDHYSSSGDNHFVGTFLPLDSPAAIAASFDLMKDVYGTRRVYWRGLQESSYVQGAPRPENVVINKVIGQARDYIDNMNINLVASNAAHARGMEFWGATQLYDWGVEAKDPIFYGTPGEYEHPLRADHPEWRPVDKYGDRRQGGPIEFAYPAARTATTNWVKNELQAANYDGVFFMTYAENFTQRHVDEFGFSDPIVNEYKLRYGKNLRRDTLDATDRQRWYDLRGEHTTAFLSELKTALTPINKKVGMAVNAQTNAMDKASYWIGLPYTIAGNQTMDWRTWAQNDSVDLLSIWGTNPDNLAILQAQTAGTGTETSLVTSEIYNSANQPVLASGTPVTGAYNMDEDYLLRSNIPVQPLSSLSSPDQYKQMRVLAQIMTGTTTATAADVTPLLTHPNLIARRMALRSLGKIGDPASVPLIEARLTDSESGIRNAAVYALADKNRPESAQLILDAVALHGNASFMEGAVLVLRNMTTAPSVLLNAIQTSPDGEVRSVAMRSLAAANSTLTPAMLPTFTAAMNDPEMYVRAYAVEAMGRVGSSNTNVTTLINAMTTSSDSVVSVRSAQSLRTLLAASDSAALPRKIEIIDGMEVLFRKFGSAGTRSDKDWAFRPVGKAMYDTVPDGRTRLRTVMNQRIDRIAAENAWDILHLQQTPGAFVNVTETADSFAHFKRPRFTTIVGASDSFDTKPNGTLINSQPAQIGQTWLVTQGTPADQVVQSTISRSGNALKTVRRAGGSHEVRLTSDAWDGVAAEISTVTAKADWLRTSTNDLTAFGIDIGAGIEAQISVDANSFYRVWQTNGTANGGTYLQTNVPAGVGGWESIEIALTYNSVSGTTLSGTYDVFLSRDALGSLGAMSRTMIAENVPIHTLAERTLQNLFISNQPNGALDVTTYWDNVSLSVGAALPSVYGDANLDSVVNSLDYNILASHLGQTAVLWTDGDFNYDGVVNNADMQLLIDNYSPAKWAVDSSGDWSIAANWTGEVPNVPIATALFGPVITAPRTVNNSAAVTVGTLTFNNLNSYKLSGSGSLTLAAALGSAQLNVQQGSHEINLPVSFATDASINVAAGAGLLISQPMTIQSGKTVTKNGSLIVSNTLTLNSNAKLLLDSGSTSVKGAPIMQAGSVIDVQDNSLLIDYANQPNPSSAVRALLVGGYAGGSWNGPGINTSLAVSGRGLGWNDNPATSSILIKFTYRGDTNLDSIVNFDDLLALAQAYGSNGQWANGDSDYNGLVNFDDLLALAQNYGLAAMSDGEAARLAGLGGASFASDWALATSLVPEPGSFFLSGLAFASLKRRRNP